MLLPYGPEGQWDCICHVWVCMHVCFCMPYDLESVFGRL